MSPIGTKRLNCLSTDVSPPTSTLVYSYGYYRKLKYYHLPAAQCVQVQWLLLPCTILTTLSLLTPDGGATAIGLCVGAAAIHLVAFLVYVALVCRLRRAVLLPKFVASAQRLQQAHAALAECAPSSSVPHAALLDARDLLVAMPVLPNADAQYTLFVRLAPDPSSDATENLVRHRFEMEHQSSSQFVV